MVEDSKLCKRLVRLHYSFYSFLYRRLLLLNPLLLLYRPLLLLYRPLLLLYLAQILEPPRLLKLPLPLPLPSL